MENKLMDTVAKIGEKDGKEFNDKVKKAQDTLKGKKIGRKRKIITSIGEMKATILYIGMDDKRFYRKISDILEIMSSPGQWTQVEVTIGFLREMKFREY